MTALDSALIDELLAGQLDLLRFEAGVRAQILAMLERLRLDLAARLAREDLTAFNKARTTILLRQVSDVINQYYIAAQGSLELSLAAVGEVASRHVVSVIMAAGLPTKTFMERLVSNTLIFGASSAEWWSRQKQELAFKFSAALRAGLLEAETNEQIVRRIVGTRLNPGIMRGPRAGVRSLVHSSIQAVANASRMETFRQNRDIITGVKQLSTLDGHTTDICIAYSGGEWDLETEKPIPPTKLPFNGGPPRHWGCRSVLVPITRTYKELGLDVPALPRAMRASGLGPIPADTTFEAWLSRRTKAQQDEQLGAGRAALWRKGTITLQQLLSLDGNPLTLRQLERKYA